MKNKNLILTFIIALIIGGLGGFFGSQFNTKKTLPNTNNTAAQIIQADAAANNYEFENQAIGNSNAKILLEEYSSFGDVNAGKIHNELFAKLKQNYIDAEKIKYVFRDFPTNQNALFATMITKCVAPENRINLINELFSKQNIWSEKPTPIAALKNIASNFGLAENDFFACIQNNELAEKIIENQRKNLKEKGINQPISFFINNEKLEGNISATAVIDGINAVLNGKSANEEFRNISKEILSVQPDETFLGRPDAPVTIIEYASLSCPHCAAFYKNIYPSLKKDFIDTGRVKFIYRNFPLNESAAKSAMLAECVGKDKFYDTIKILFEKQDEWAFADDFLVKLKDITSSLGLTENDFNSCLANKDLENKIAQEPFMARMKLGIESTPTFFVNGKKEDHMHNIAEFKAAIEAAEKSK